MRPAALTIAAVAAVVALTFWAASVPALSGPTSPAAPPSPRLGCVVDGSCFDAPEPTDPKETP